MAGKIFGRAFIRVNGQTIPSIAGSGKLNPGGFERSPVVGDAGYLGHTEKPVHAEIECEIAISADMDIKALQDTTDAVITFECDSGQVYVMRNASCAAPINLQAGTDGKAPVKFIGSAVVQS